MIAGPGGHGTGSQFQSHRGGPCRRYIRDVRRMDNSNDSGEHLQGAVTGCESACPYCWHPPWFRSRLIYLPALSQAATDIRKEVNVLDNQTTGKAVDALLNYETVALFNNQVTCPVLYSLLNVHFAATFEVCCATKLLTSRAKA